MMDQNTYRPISKDVHSKDDLDFHFLKEEGIKVIQRLGNKLWTDYNTHDPGITILEILAYAIILINIFIWPQMLCHASL